MLRDRSKTVIEGKSKMKTWMKMWSRLSVCLSCVLHVSVLSRCLSVARLLVPAILAAVPPLNEGFFPQRESELSKCFEAGAMFLDSIQRAAPSCCA